MRDQLRRVGEDLSNTSICHAACILLQLLSLSLFFFSTFPPFVLFPFFLDLVDETPRDGPRKSFPKKGIINNWHVLRPLTYTTSYSAGQRHYLTEINRVKYLGKLSKFKCRQFSISLTTSPRKKFFFFFFFFPKHHFQGSQFHLCQSSSISSHVDTPVI